MKSSFFPFDVAEMDVEDLGPLAESIIGFLAK